jgi:hypothetical protein
MKLFPHKTKEATMAELLQLHKMEVFQPVNKLSLTRQELLGVLNTITFIKRKRCGHVKARTCADERPQR